MEIDFGSGDYGTGPGGDDRVSDDRTGSPFRPGHILVDLLLTRCEAQGRQYHYNI